MPVIRTSELARPRFSSIQGRPKKPRADNCHLVELSGDLRSGRQSVTQSLQGHRNYKTIGRLVCVPQPSTSVSALASDLQTPYG